MNREFGAWPMFAYPGIYKAITTPNMPTNYLVSKQG